MTDENNNNTPSVAAAANMISYNLRLPKSLETEFITDINDLLFTLNTSTPNDIINIYCSGEGGQEFFAYQIINSIKYCQNHLADICIIVDSSCESAHALVALAADVIEIHTYGIHFLFHRGSGGFNNDAPANKVMEQRMFLMKESDKADKDLGLYEVLTNKELKLYQKGEDIFISGEDMRVRLKKIGKEVW